MENDIDPVRFLTLRQTTDMLQISRRTMLRMLKSKKLPAFKVGRQWRVRESELTKWLQGLNER
jgi:excisionase family DNA binding protein